MVQSCVHSAHTSHALMYLVWKKKKKPSFNVIAVDFYEVEIEEKKKEMKKKNNNLRTETKVELH